MPLLSSEVPLSEESSKPSIISNQMEALITNKHHSAFSKVKSPALAPFASKKQSKLNHYHSDSQENSSLSGNRPSTDHQQSSPAFQKDILSSSASPAALNEAIESCDLKEQIEDIYT